VKLPKLPVDVTGADFLNYKTVRRMFGWNDNRSIRDAVQAGKLVRVHLGTGRQDFRITAESAVAFRTAVLEEAEAAAFFEKTPGQMKAMRQARKREAVPEIDVELNEAEITRQADNLKPVPPVSCETFINQQTTPAPRPDWRVRNAWIEGGMIGPDPWAARPRH